MSGNGNGSENGNDNNRANNNRKWIDQRVASLSLDDLHAYNAAVNARLAGILGDTEVDVLPLPPISEHLPEYLLSLGDGSKSLEGIATGMVEIDHLIGGLSKFTLLAARAGVGKSTLAVQLAIGAATTTNIPTIFYSYEMSRADIFTMMAQNLHSNYEYKLTRREIVLFGNAPDNADRREAIKEATAALQELSSLFYVIDATDGPPTISRMEADIKQITARHHGTPPLVIIDSIQDLVSPDGNGATMAEAQTAQQIVELQQNTKATILAISQKAKGANALDPYAGVLGSVSLLHKPTCVLELVGVHDLIRNVKDPELTRTYTMLADSADTPRPVVVRVLKGRNNGSGHVSLKHYGKYGYLEVGRIIDYDANPESSLYDLNGLVN